MSRGKLNVPEINLKPKQSFVEEKRSFYRTVLELSFLDEQPFLPPTEIRIKGAEAGRREKVLHEHN